MGGRRDYKSEWTIFLFTTQHPELADQPLFKNQSELATTIASLPPALLSSDQDGSEENLKPLGFGAAKAMVNETVQEKLIYFKMGKYTQKAIRMKLESQKVEPTIIANILNRFDDLFRAAKVMSALKGYAPEVLREILRAHTLTPSSPQSGSGGPTPS